MVNKLWQSKHQQGFTLVELLLALAIFAMLASALAPGIISQGQIRGAQAVSPT